MHYITTAMLMALLALSCQKEQPKPAAPPPTTAPAPKPPEEPKGLPAPADVAAAPADAEKTASGLASKVLQKGTGTEHPTSCDTVEVHYTGWMTNGKMFDSTVTRGSPFEFPLFRVIKGWTEGVQLMVKGEKRRFWIPANLAYGETPRRPGAPFGMLVFDIELLGIKKGPAIPEDVAATPKSAKKTKSGISYLVLTKGQGKDHPTAESTVKITYTGWTTKGQCFDSSTVNGQPFERPLDAVGIIKGWTEGVQLMVVGEKTRFWIPGTLAYGDDGKADQPGRPSGTLVFDIELVDFKKAPPAPAVPTDVAAVPKNAKTTESGLAYRVLTKGKGKEHPTADNTVKVHYTGWTTDGKRFDSSVVRGEPAEFPLKGVIKGWTEGVQLMVVGEKTRFWIPGKIAYGDEPNPMRPGAPYGMLVFDIELLEIKK